MFCREILSFKKSPAMLDHSALALNQEGSDAGGPLKRGNLRRDPDAGQQVGHDRSTKEVGLGCDLRYRPEMHPVNEGKELADCRSLLIAVYRRELDSRWVQDR